MKQEKQNPFIKYNGIKDAKVHIHKTSGLYDASNEHDACGVGMIVDIHGNKSHELVDSALKVLENMKHRVCTAVFWARPALWPSCWA